MADTPQDTKGQKQTLQDTIFKVVGHLPAPMLAILAAAAILAFAAGVFLKVVPAPAIQQADFPPLRLRADKAITIDDALLTGTWGYQGQDMSMAIKFSGPQGGQLFEWIVARRDLSSAQFYARGSYRVFNDVIVLQQRDDMGAPYDAERPYLKYLPMAFRDVSLRMRVMDGARALTWMLPADEAARIPREFLLVWPVAKDHGEERVRQDRQLTLSKLSDAYK